MSKLGVSSQDADFLLRLEILEQKYEGDRSFYQFHHRNFRQLIVSLYPSNNATAKLETQIIKSRLKDTHLSVFRCTMAQIQRCKDSMKAALEAKIINLTRHILLSCTSVDEWRWYEMTCEIIQVGYNQPLLKESVRKILRIFIAEDDVRGFYLDPKLKKSLQTDFITVMIQHLDKACDSCHLPLSLKTRNQFEKGDTPRPTYNWPDNHAFVMHPFLIKTAGFIAFFLPRRKSFFHAKHIVRTSVIIQCRKPEKGILSKVICTIYIVFAAPVNAEVLNEFD